MKKQKLTPWFPPEVRPAHPGVYISTVNRARTFYRLWDGSNWHYGHESDPAKAATINDIWLPPEFLHWRGLAEKPQ